MPNTMKVPHCHLTNGDHPCLTENETPMAAPDLNSRATAGMEHRNDNTHLNATGKNPVTIQGPTRTDGRDRGTSKACQIKARGKPVEASKADSRPARTVPATRCTSQWNLKNPHKPQIPRQVHFMKNLAHFTPTSPTHHGYNPPGNTITFPSTTPTTNTPSSTALLGQPPSSREKLSLTCTRWTWEAFAHMQADVKHMLCQFKKITVTQAESSRYNQCSKRFLGTLLGLLRLKEEGDVLVTMIVKDLQPFSTVEDEGFQKLVKKLDPTYVLPSRKTVKLMVRQKYQEEKQKAMEHVKNIPFVCLTADMWTSLTMESYLRVTCHYTDSNTELGSVVLGVSKFPKSHTADNIKEALSDLIITNWFSCCHGDRQCGQHGVRNSETFSLALLIL
ncbi:hypothetical protein QQF64_004520 [Cirrhinus molitorella]|uniref:Uncharacterized protein n=1 Tax=Cirrhinus molitorella TaxID=172907 RepID=A0ABR3MGQ8_9TELE